MIVSMRVVGVTQAELPASIIFAGVAAVFVITVLPISPGGAGVPDLLYISFYTTYTGGADSSAISAAVMLFRAFQLVPADPDQLGPPGDLAQGQVAPADEGGVQRLRAHPERRSRQRLTVSPGPAAPARGARVGTERPRTDRLIPCPRWNDTSTSLAVGCSR